MDVLVLCTANICRSPIAQALLAHHAVRRATDVRVLSAGGLDEGCAASADGVDVMAGRGLDLSKHRSRRLTAEMAEAVDLVVCMAREHVAHTLAVAPGAAGKVFTLKGLVRRGEAAGPRRAGETVADWLARVDDAVGATMPDGPDDDVRDPIGMGRATYERLADELDDLAARLADLVWGAPVGQPA